MDRVEFVCDSCAAREPRGLILRRDDPNLGNPARGLKHWMAGALVERAYIIAEKGS